MSPELEHELVSNYPDLFRDKDKPPTESLMYFGCECGDGWFNILSLMCSCIQQHIKNGHWQYAEPYRFFQIKEKFAGLRVYDSGHDDYISGVIAMAETLSYHTCEECGNVGRVCCSKGGYWLRTLCPEHMDKLDYRRVEKNEEA
jgi:hypothetical protein